MSRPLEDIQDAILDRLHAGEPVDREAAMRDHPEHAEALGRFFSLLDSIEGPGEPKAPAPTSLGEFEIVREIGRGGMGVVYEAEQMSLKRRVALKVLPPALGRDDRLLARFRREAEAAARLRHPNIVPVYSVGEAAGTPFFAMELVEGRSLAEVIRDRREGKDAGFPPAGPEYRRWAVETVTRVADALAYAHGRGILHRDVKPGNLLLERDGTPRLTDFGLALDLAGAGLTLSSEVFGSPQYMSPEQAFRRETPVDQRTDVYSLGVTLYELLTLRLPYEGSTGPEMLAALGEGKVVPPRKVDPQMPSALERVLLRALRRDPKERYPDAGAFAEDLRRVLGEEPVAAPPRRRARRRSVLVGGLAVLAIAAVLLVARPWMYERVDEGWNPTRTEILRLADGTLEEGANLLAKWVRPSVAIRHVLSRETLGTYECVLRLDTPKPGVGGEKVFLDADWEVQVDDGPWKPLFPGGTEMSNPITVDGFELFVRPRLDWILGEASQRETVRLRHRAKIRVLRKDPPTEGTRTTWTDEQSLLLYDDYPPDYPAAVSDREIDALMREGLTPKGFEYLGVAASGDTKVVDLALHLEYSDLPVPVAAEVELYAPDVVGAIGESRITLAPQSTGGSMRTRMPVSFRLSGMERRQEAGFLLDLESGRIRSLKLVFRASRAVALEETGFDRYWAGTAVADDPRRDGDPASPR